MSNIMVIEDNNELQHYLVTVLRSAGHRVIGVSSSQKGIEAARQNSFQFDLLLLDVNLGDGTAFDFLEKVKEENSMFDPRICFVSSRRDQETVKRAVAMGAGDYIVKPVLSGTLIAKVNKLLGDSTSEEKFSSATCSFKAEVFGSDMIQPDLLVTQVSETGIILRSSAMLQEGALVPLAVGELQQLIEHDSDHIIFRVNKCEKSSWGKYQAEADFVGLGEDKLTKLRAFTIRGSFIGDAGMKKPA